jgi:phage-related protein
MGKVVKGVFNAVKKVVTTVLKSPILSFAASFIPVIGPFVGMASKIYNGVQALKSGNLLGAASSFLGGTGIGKALGNTFSNVLGKVGNLVGPNVMGFATSAVKALGGNSTDMLKIADIAKNALAQTQNQELLTAARHNATRLLQFGQAQQYV